MYYVYMYYIYILYVICNIWYACIYVYIGLTQKDASPHSVSSSENLC